MLYKALKMYLLYVVYYIPGGGGGTHIYAQYRYVPQ